MAEVKEIVGIWLDEVQSELIANYDKLGLRASGRWANALEQFYKENETEIVTGITGAQYTGALEYGRLPNKNQDPKYLRKFAYGFGKNVIEKWCGDKGIDKKLAIPIAYKIAKEGWRVPNTYNAGGLVANVFTKEKIKELSKKLAVYYISKIETELVNTLKPE